MFYKLFAVHASESVNIFAYILRRDKNQLRYYFTGELI